MLLHIAYFYHKCGLMDFTKELNPLVENYVLEEVLERVRGHARVCSY